MNRLASPLRWKYATLREYKSDMRSRAILADKAIDDLCSGCAFSPAYSEISELRKLVKLVRERQSVKRWGR